MMETKLLQKTISFHIDGFWFHLNPETFRDQYGDRWVIAGQYIRHEHGILKVKRAAL
jgi:hypothetical protein